MVNKPFPSILARVQFVRMPANIPGSNLDIFFSLVNSFGIMFIKTLKENWDWNAKEKPTMKNITEEVQCPVAIL